MICCPKAQGKEIVYAFFRSTNHNRLESNLCSVPGFTCEGLTFLRNDGRREAANARWIWMRGLGMVGGGYVDRWRMGFNLLINVTGSWSK